MFSVLSRISVPNSLSKPVIICRNVSFLKKVTNTAPVKRLVDKEKHKLIYESKCIKYMTALVRSKFSLPVVLIPFLSYFYTVDGPLFSAVLFFGGFHVLSVQIASLILNNLIGKIYVNKDGEVNEVIVCSLNNWGRRIDRIHSPGDLISVDIPILFNQLQLSRVLVKDCEVNYILHKKLSQVHDSVNFSVLFEGSAKNQLSKS